MNQLHNSTARLCICALGLSFSLSGPALAQVQTPAASRQVRSAPASREALGDDRGGHFAAWEYPELFAAELRAAFKPLR